MDFDSDLVQIQGALLKANNTHKFKYITSRGGNENEINVIINQLRTQLLNKNYIDENGINKNVTSILRKINLFMIFNTDFDILEDLANSDDIGHLIWSTPMLTKCLLVHVVWGLNMDDFYCEAIQHSCPQLSLDLLQIATQNMKYSDPETCIKRINKLGFAAYGMTCKLLYNQTKNDSQKAILNGVFDCVCALMKYFGGDSPNKSKMDSWGVDRLYLQVGNTLYNIFDMLIKCFTIFLDRNQCLASKDLNLYSFTFDEENSDTSPEKIDNINDIIEEYLIKFNDLFIHITRMNVMPINVDVYCSWAESDSDEDPNKTLQRAIGESAYKLQNIMNSDTRFNCELISMLEPLSCKPIELSDIIRDADEQTVYKMANKSTESQSEWLNAFSKRDFLFTDDRYLDCLIRNVNLLSIEHRSDLFKLCVDCLYDTLKYEFETEIKILAMACFKILSVENKNSILTSTFSEVDLDDFLELDDFDCEVTEFFNKLIKFSENVVSSLLHIFIQNPLKFYIKAFEIVSRNHRALAIMDAFEYCKKLYNIKYKTDIMQLILIALGAVKIESFRTDFEKRSFVTLIKQIYTKNIIRKETILLHYLIPSIDKHATSHNLSYTLIYMECLQEIYDTDDVNIPTAATLVLCAQILESLRWELNNFSSNAVEIVDLTIKLQQKLIESFVQINKSTDKDWLWTIEKLDILSPINAVYYSHLLGDDAANLLDAASCESELKHFISYMLPRSTLTEVKKMFLSLCSRQDPTKCFVLFCGIIKQIAIKSKQLNSLNAYACLEHCCRNLGIVMEEPVLRNVLLDHYTVLLEIVNVLNLIPRAINEEVFNCFLSLTRRVLLSSKNNITSDGNLSLENAIILVDTLQSYPSKITLRQILEIETDY